MSAEIVVLADVRAARARVTVQVSVEPCADLSDELITAFWAWVCYLTGDKPRAREVKGCDVRTIGGR